MSERYGGMRKASDWAARRVWLTRQVQNGMGVVPEGTVGTLGRVIKEGHISFIADKCKCCGGQFKVSHLHYEDFRPVDGVYTAPVTVRV